MQLNGLERGFKRVGISEKENFTKLLGKLVEREGLNIEIIKDIRRKVFILLNRRSEKLKLIGKKTSTSSITTFTGISVKLLLKISDFSIQEIKYLGSVDFYESISSMCHCSGIPKKYEIISFFQVFDESILAFFGDKKDLIKSISSMCNGSGIPEKDEIISFFQIFDDERIATLGDKKDLFKSISSMYHGSGIPEKDEIISFFQVFDDERLAALGDKKDLFKSISSMCSNKLIPKEDVIISFFKVLNIITKKLNIDFIQSLKKLSTQFNTKGIPKENEIENCLKK